MINLTRLEKRIFLICKGYYDDNKYETRFDAVEAALISTWKINYTDAYSIYKYILNLTLKIIPGDKFENVLRDLYSSFKQSYTCRDMTEHYISHLGLVQVIDDVGTKLIDI